MNSQPKVSVIVPIYNVEKFLEQCIDSVLQQTYSNLELILVNDGSTDSSGEICDSYAKADNRIAVIHKVNGGPSDARNVGIKEIHGEYTLFLDGDDWLDLDTVQRAVESAQENKAQLVLWGYMREFMDHSKPRQLFAESACFEGQEYNTQIYRKMFGLASDEMRYIERSFNFVTVWAKLYKSELIYGHTFTDTKSIGTCEDGLFNAQVLGHVKKAVYLNFCFNHYRKNDISLTRGIYHPNLGGQYLNLFFAYENVVVENNLTKDFKEALQNQICCCFLGLAIDEIRNPKGFIEQSNNLKKWLNNEKVKQAFEQLEFKPMPLHWKLYFWLAKVGWLWAVILLTQIIEKLKQTRIIKL